MGKGGRVEATQKYKGVGGSGVKKEQKSNQKCIRKRKLNFRWC